jgi:hypothetical protein
MTNKNGVFLMGFQEKSDWPPMRCIVVSTSARPFMSWSFFRIYKRSMEIGNLSGIGGLDFLNRANSADWHRFHITQRHSQQHSLLCSANPLEILPPTRAGEGTETSSFSAPKPRQSWNESHSIVELSEPSLRQTSKRPARVSSSGTVADENARPVVIDEAQNSRRLSRRPTSTPNYPNSSIELQL